VIKMAAAGTLRAFWDIKFLLIASLSLENKAQGVRQQLHPLFFFQV